MRLWRWARPQPGMIGGMAGGVIPVIGNLPEAGGTLDQSAWLIAAFDVLDEAHGKMAPPQG